MTGFLTKEEIENFTEEDQFIFNFNLLWTSGDYWERTPENVKPREEALRELYRKSCRHEPLVSDDFCGDCGNKFNDPDKKVYSMNSAIFGEIYPKGNPICDDCANKRYELKRIESESKNSR